MQEKQTETNTVLSLSTCLEVTTLQILYTHKSDFFVLNFNIFTGKGGKEKEGRKGRNNCYSNTCSQTSGKCCKKKKINNNCVLSEFYSSLLCPDTILESARH